MMPPGAGMPRPPMPGTPAGGTPVARKDPFGLGAPSAPPPTQARGPELPSVVVEDSLPEQRGAEEISLDVGGSGARAPGRVSGDGGEALLRDALSKASREVIEKIAWEVVPQLAETIIREELERLIKDREAKG